MHGTQGYFILFLAVTLSALDVIALGSRLIAFFRAIKSGDHKFDFSSLWNVAILSKGTLILGSKVERSALVAYEYELEEAD